jgi:hypothetical protein
MTSSKSYTWAEFQRGLEKLPQDIVQKALPEIREEIYKDMAQLESFTDSLAVTMLAPGTKHSNHRIHRTKIKNRQYGANLATTIQRFKNKRNPLMAYVVLGNLKEKRGGAIYGPMQLAGYRPGRPSKANKDLADYLIGKGRISKSRKREALAKLNPKIPGKNYLAVGMSLFGKATEEIIFHNAVGIVDKYLAKV